MHTRAKMEVDMGIMIWEGLNAINKIRTPELVSSTIHTSTNENNYIPGRNAVFINKANKLVGNWGISIV